MIILINVLLIIGFLSSFVTFFNNLGGSAFSKINRYLILNRTINAVAMFVFIYLLIWFNFIVR